MAVYSSSLNHSVMDILIIISHIGVQYLQEYFDRRNEVRNMLALTKTTITRVEVVGMGDRVCVDLCSLMRPGEGLLVHLIFFLKKNSPFCFISIIS